MAVQTKPGGRGASPKRKSFDFFRRQDKFLRSRGINPFTMKPKDKGVTRERRRQPPRPFQKTRTF